MKTTQELFRSHSLQTERYKKNKYFGRICFKKRDLGKPTHSQQPTELFPQLWSSRVQSFRYSEAIVAVVQVGPATAGAGTGLGIKHASFPGKQNVRVRDHRGFHLNFRRRSGRPGKSV